MSFYAENKKLTVINFFAPPGSGKSTTATHTFALFKRKEYDIELVTEYAKDLVWSDRHLMFTEQDYIFAKQHHRLRRLIGKVDIAITDSPILLGLFYLPPGYPSSFSSFVLEVFNSYNNINILLNRTKKYVQLGRNQTEEESNQIGVEIRNKLDELNIPYIQMDGDENTPEKIVRLISGGQLCVK